eukprot:346132-Prymnesium_polylepis.1
MVLSLAAYGAVNVTTANTRWSIFAEHRTVSKEDLAINSTCAVRPCRSGDCQHACELDQQCRGFVLYEQTCHFRGGNVGCNGFFQCQAFDAKATLFVLDRDAWLMRIERASRLAFFVVWSRTVSLPSDIVCYNGCDGIVAQLSVYVGMFVFICALYYLGEAVMYVACCRCFTRGQREPELV